MSKFPRRPFRLHVLDSLTRMPPPRLQGRAGAGGGVLDVQDKGVSDEVY